MELFFSVSTYLHLRTSKYILAGSRGGVHRGDCYIFHHLLKSTNKLSPGVLVQGLVYGGDLILKAPTKNYNCVTINSQCVGT